MTTEMIDKYDGSQGAFEAFEKFSWGDLVKAIGGTLGHPVRARTLNSLLRTPKLSIKTVGELAALPDEAFLMGARGFGEGCLATLNTALTKLKEN